MPSIDVRSGIIGAIRLTACDAVDCPNCMVASIGRASKVAAIGVNLGLLLPRGKLKYHESCLARSAAARLG